MSISRIVSRLASKNTVKSVFPFPNSPQLSVRFLSSDAGESERKALLKNLLNNFTFEEKPVRIINLVDRKLNKEPEMKKIDMMRRELIKRSIGAAKKHNHRVALGLFNQALNAYWAVESMNMSNAEEFYGPLLMFLIDREMVREFYMLSDYLKIDEATRCYYDMVLSLKLGDVVKLQNLVAKMVVVSNTPRLEMFIRRFCDSFEVHLAIDLVNSMLKCDLNVTSNILDPILKACEKCNEHHLVRCIFSIIKDHNLRASTESFGIMIKLLVKLDDFEGAYGILDYVKRLDLSPTTNMYNTIMLGYLQKKHFHSGSKVLKDMDASGAKPDCDSFTYIIGHCTTEDDILRYYDKMCRSGVPPTKHLHKALIQAYVACGCLERARHVVNENGTSDILHSELMNTLAYSLALNGKIDEAMGVYDEVLQSQGTIEPITALCLIQRVDSADNLNLLLELLKHLTDTDLWDAGCSSILLFCVRHKNLDQWIQLLEKLFKKPSMSISGMHFTIVQMFWELWMQESADPIFGLSMMKEMEGIQLGPTRKALELLLGTCRKAGDLRSSIEICQKYKKAELPLNPVTRVGIYQAFLASGEHESASNIKETIPLDFKYMPKVLATSQKTLAKVRDTKQSVVTINAN